MASSEGVELAKAYVQIIPSANGIQAGIQSALTGGGVAAAASSAGGIITAGIGAAVVGVGALVKDALETGADFDAAISKVKAVAGLTEEQFQTVREKALQLGASTKYTASEAADAFYYMAMAGWKAEDMLSGIDGVMSLAAASGEELGSVSDIVTDALTAFGLSASDAGHFSDVLAAASSNANTNVGLMGQTFQYVAPIAGAMGYSIEDVATAIGAMANSGIKGSMAGTALRNILTNMANPTDKMANAMDKLGVSLTGADGEMLSLGALMDALRENFGNGITDAEGFATAMEAIQEQYDNGSLSDGEYEQAVSDLAAEFWGARDSVEKLSLAADLAGKYGMAGLLAIVNTSTEDFDKLTGAIGDCDGAAAEMAKTMNDNLAGDLVIFQSALDGAKIALAEGLTPAVRGFVQDATAAFSDFTEKLKNEGPEAAFESMGEAAGKLTGEILEHVPEMVEAGTKFLIAFGQGLLSPESISAIGGALVDWLITDIERELAYMWSGITSPIEWLQGIVDEHFGTPVEGGYGGRGGTSEEWNSEIPIISGGDTININLNADNVEDLADVVDQAKNWSRVNRMGNLGGGARYEYAF